MTLDTILRSSVNMDPGCGFSVKLMGASDLCKHTSLFHQMQLLASCSLQGHTSQTGGLLLYKELRCDVYLSIKIRFY